MKDTESYFVTAPSLHVYIVSEVWNAANTFLRLQQKQGKHISYMRVLAEVLQRT